MDANGELVLRLFLAGFGHRLMTRIGIDSAAVGEPVGTRRVASPRKVSGSTILFRESISLVNISSLYSPRSVNSQTCGVPRVPRKNVTMSIKPDFDQICFTGLVEMGNRSHLDTCALVFEDV